MAKMILKPTSFKIALILTLFISILYYFRGYIGLIEDFESRILDAHFRIRGAVEPGERVVIVVIDNKSIEEIGRWPWSRRVFADLLDILSKAGAKVAALDIIFSEPEETKESRLLDEILRDYQSMNFKTLGKSGEEFYRKIKGLRNTVEADKYFVEAINRSGNVVVPFVFNLFGGTESKTEQGDYLYLKEAAYSKHDNQVVFISPLPAREISLLPLKEIGASSKGTGFVNVFPERDGLLRREIMAIDYKGEYFPPFSIQVVKLFWGLNREDLRFGPYGDIVIGDHIISTDEYGRALINYYGPPYSFPYYSFTDVLHGRIPESIFKNNIVIIGAGASALGDHYPTSFSEAMWGVEKNATVILNILNSEFIVANLFTSIINLSVILLFGLSLGFSLPRLRVIWQSVIAISLLIIYFMFSQYLFTKYLLWVNFLYPFLAVISVFIGITIFQYITEGRQKRFIKRAFGQYLSPTVVQQLMDDPKRLKLGGEKRVMTALFSDVAGFSGISETLSPEVLVALLNKYLTEMSEIIINHGGTVDKYEGDAIIAFFGAPVTFDDHPIRACHSAIDMQKRLSLLREEWKGKGHPELFMRIGINTGPMVVGNMGSVMKMDYTIMGDSVNLASRLEGVNKVYGTDIIISEETYRKVMNDIGVRNLDTIRVVGKKEPITIYEVLGNKSEITSVQEKLIEYYTNGLRAYSENNWDEAIKNFQRALEFKEDDHPSLTMMERCIEYKERGIKDFKGIFELKAK